MLSLTQPSTSGSPPASTDPLHHNLVERWFSELTTKLLKTRAAPLGPSPQQRHRNWIEDPRPYVWTKTADQIGRGSIFLVRRPTPATPSPREAPHEFPNGTLEGGGACHPRWRTPADVRIH